MVVSILKPGNQTKQLTYLIINRVTSLIFVLSYKSMLLNNSYHFLSIISSFWRRLSRSFAWRLLHSWDSWASRIQLHRQSCYKAPQLWKKQSRQTRFAQRRFRSKAKTLNRGTTASLLHRWLFCPGLFCFQLQQTETWRALLDWLFP